MDNNTYKICEYSGGNGNCGALKDPDSRERKSYPCNAKEPETCPIRIKKKSNTLEIKV